MIPVNYSSAEFEQQYTYKGHDLGAIYTPQATTFRVWAPTAASVSLRLYCSGDPFAQDLQSEIPMKPDEKGTWTIRAAGNLDGLYYTYHVSFPELETEACDPYAKATGVNGRRAMILDLSATNPVGWESDRDPHAGAPITDTIIYEAHIRDLSADPDSGILHKGKYLGLAESGTHTPSGKPTGLDHIRSLGVTHVHILPMYDFGFTDESRAYPQYNWGYDPENYNVPEGSYATDAQDGRIRIREMKEMVKALHDAGLSVVMDVVYNHVFEAYDFCFNKIVPLYFSRTWPDGTLTNASGCGNDTASERSMVRKYIVDSVKYWADEYHIDGFRFDLVGLIDTQTVNELVAQVHKDHPNVIFYGEGWDMAQGITKPDTPMATQKNAHLVPNFAFFNDTIRDQLKGSVFETEEKGFISGGEFSREELVAAFKGQTGWAPCPGQSINYASCHDNNTLIDRITLSTPESTQQDRIRMNRLAAAFCLLSQGVPFFHAGEELLRSKPDGNGSFDHNSYRAPDRVNAIHWRDLDKPECAHTLRYYQGLIALRKASPALRLTTKEAVDKSVTLLDSDHSRLIPFLVKDKDAMILIFNGGNEDVDFKLPKGRWNVLVNHDRAGTQVLETVEHSVAVGYQSAMVLKQVSKEKKTISTGMLVAGAAVLGAITGTIARLVRRRK